LILSFFRIWFYCRHFFTIFYIFQAVSADEFPVGNLPYKSRDGLSQSSPDSTTTTTSHESRQEGQHTVETTTTTTTTTTTVRQQGDEGDDDFPDSTTTSASSPGSAYRFERREVRRTQFTQQSAEPKFVDESFEESSTTAGQDEESSRLTTEVWNLDVSGRNLHLCDWSNGKTRKIVLNRNDETMLVLIANLASIKVIKTLNSLI